MTKIREGDIVTVQILVTEVADYASKENPEGQQVLGKMLPRGGQVGWLVPQEARVTLHSQNFKVGDRVYLDSARSRAGEVKAYIPSTDQDTAQLWVKPDGEWKLETVTVHTDIRRVD